jgi:UDP-N-acetylmuramoyl-tripeptide--D-alanyl-D-alanine ligase
LGSAKIEKLVFTGVSIDSRKCKKSEIFFAIKGERFDGHSFIKDVIPGGVRAVVAQKKWFKKLSGSEKRSLNNKPIVLVDDTIKSFGELARNYRRKFIIPVIAIAGSNGKTSTKDFIANVLSQRYNVLKTEGNFNNAIGVPLTLFRLSRKHEFCVVEFGTNHFGEIDYLCNVAEPQFGVITNIGKEHLEFLNDLRGVAKAEGELIEYQANNFGTFFLNMNDSHLVKKAAHKEMSIFTYGTTDKCDVKGRIIKYKGFNPEIEIKCGKKKINTVLNTIGSQSFNSALAAAAAGFYFDVHSEGIKKAISKFQQRAGKRNQLKNSNGYWVIDDTYNSNPDSVKAALENLKVYKVKGKKHIVLADMLELGGSSSKEHKSIGRLIKDMKFNNLYTYGRESLNTFKAARGVKNNFYFEDKTTLSQMLKRSVKKGDVVLVKGSRSMKMEEVVNGLTK